MKIPRTSSGTFLSSSSPNSLCGCKGILTSVDQPGNNFFHMPHLWMTFRPNLRTLSWSSTSKSGEVSTLGLNLSWPMQRCIFLFAWQNQGGGSGIPNKKAYLVFLHILKPLYVLIEKVGTEPEKCKWRGGGGVPNSHQWISGFEFE